MTFLDLFFAKRPMMLASRLARMLHGAVICVAGVLVAGSAAADLGGRGHGAHYHFAWMANDPNNTYDAATLAGVRDVAADSHSLVDPFYAGFDPPTQLAQCLGALASDAYDGLFIESASATEIEPCVAQAFLQGVPVVATDLPIGPDPNTVAPQVPGEVGACFIVAPEFAEALHSNVPLACQTLDPCNVLYVAGDLTFALDQEAVAALDQVATPPSTIHLIDVVEAFYDTPTARAVVDAELTAHPEINFVVAGGDQMALGAEQAAGDHGVTVGIIGAGAGASAIKAVLEGRWYGTFNALPRTEGQIGAKLMVHALRDRNATPRGIDPIVATGLPLMWTKATLADFPSFVPQWPGP
jgi:ABC-type sugar transport system substrate-binding protein